MNTLPAIEVILTFETSLGDAINIPPNLQKTDRRSKEGKELHLTKVACLPADELLYFLSEQVIVRQRLPKRRLISLYLTEISGGGDHESVKSSSSYLIILFGQFQSHLLGFLFLDTSY